MGELNKTSLYESHLALDAKMVDFAEYLMPIHYSNGIQHEYLSVRNDVGLFDVSHMGVFKVSGPNCDNFLNYILSNNIKKLPNGKAMYTLLCNTKGGVIDDLIVYRLNNEFILIVNASNKKEDLEWIKNNNSKEEIQVHDISNSNSLIAIQGPNSKDKIEQLLNINLDMDFYSCMETQYSDENIFIARTGYTGELGFEILGNSNIINGIWDQMISNGISPIGLAVRDILRIEMGYCLYGHEIDTNINPLDAGLSWIIDDKSNFIGSKEIQNINNQRDKLIFFKTLERGIPREGFDIFIGEEKVGLVTSGTFSYLMGCGLGIGFIKRNIEKYNDASLSIRDKKISIEISTKPLMSNTSLRK